MRPDNQRTHPSFKLSNRRSHPNVRTQTATCVENDGPCKTRQELLEMDTKCDLHLEFADKIPSGHDVVRLKRKVRFYMFLSKFIDNPWLGILSSLVICGGALFEAFEAVGEIEEGLWHSKINKSALGLAIIALGHFMHYFKELLKVFVEMDEGLLVAKEAVEKAEKKRTEALQNERIKRSVTEGSEDAPPSPALA
eukprot:CAMPEP_0167760102 /NCGR_PEP_ID=MMETSP0110_2-20121227/11398_1 /TAXON_ID=629695 /ORGANISM="Gymnochlora sp., Strain CCMP2014" /LENGTH=194 /DNA_ID=CAMNT_0007646573 /DNA_START=74 /DNA_END=658 /DNA_ORIENTATION=-